MAAAFFARKARPGIATPVKVGFGRGSMRAASDAGPISTIRWPMPLPPTKIRASQRSSSTSAEASKPPRRRGPPKKRQPGGARLRGRDNAGDLSGGVIEKQSRMRGSSGARWLCGVPLAFEYAAALRSRRGMRYVSHDRSRLAPLDPLVRPRFARPPSVASGEGVEVGSNAMKVDHVKAG